MRPAEGDEAAEEDDEEARADEGEAEHGGHAEGLEGAITHAEADEVPVGAVAQEAVDVIGDGFQGGRVGGHAQVGDGLLSEHGRDVELLVAAGGEEELDYRVEFGPGYLACRGVEELDALEFGSGGGRLRIGTGERCAFLGFGGADGVDGDELRDSLKGLFGCWQG